MPTPTQLIYTDQPGGLPATYVVPASSEIVVSSIFARFNGAAASGSFLPCLDILSQSGQLMARVAVSQTLAVGDSARVTWAPFLRRTRAMAPAVKVGRAAGDPTITVPDGFAFVTIVPWTTVYWDTHGMFAGGTSNDLTAPMDGIYHVVGEVAYNVNAAGDYGIAVATATNFEGEVQLGSTGAYFVNIQAVADVALRSGETVQVHLEQKTGAGRNLANTDCFFSAHWVREYP